MTQPPDQTGTQGGQESVVPDHDFSGGSVPATGPAAPHANLAQVDADIDAVRENRRHAIELAKIAARGGVYSAIAGGIFLFGSTILNDDPPPPLPEVVHCGEEIGTTLDALSRYPDIWQPISETSQVQKQCKINEYVVRWQADHADDPPAARVPGPAGPAPVEPSP